MIGIIGLGHVGLTVGLCFSQFCQVYGYDIDQEKIKGLTVKKLPFYEPFLETILKDTLYNTFHIVDLRELVRRSKYIFICLPVKTDDKAKDIEFLVNEIGKVLWEADEHKIIIIKSTVLPGTCASMNKKLIKMFGEFIDFSIIMNPEFLTEGSAVENFMNPGKIVLGGDNDKALDEVERLYKIFDATVIKTNFETAEFCKYAYNSLLATMISFSNEIASTAEKFKNIDVKKIFEIIHNDYKFKSGDFLRFIWPGCGYGGSCFPKDTRAIVNEMGKKGIDMKMVKATIETNKKRIRDFCEEILLQASHDYRIKTIGILGLSFKSGTSDIRNSVAIEVIKYLKQYQYPIVVHDPIATQRVYEKFGDELEYCSSVNGLIERADLIVVINKDDAFKKVVNSKKPYIDGRYFL